MGSQDDARSIVDEYRFAAVVTISKHTGENDDGNSAFPPRPVDLNDSG